MSTFNYRIVNGKEEVSSHEAPSYAAARNDALGAFGKIISDIRHQHGPKWTELTLTLTDDKGLALLKLEFAATETAAVTQTPQVD